MDRNIKISKRFYTLIHELVPHLFSFEGAAGLQVSEGGFVLIVSGFQLWLQHTDPETTILLPLSQFFSGKVTLSEITSYAR